MWDSLILEARQRLPTNEIQSIARTKKLTFRYDEIIGQFAIDRPQDLTPAEQNYTQIEYKYWSLSLAS